MKKASILLAGMILLTSTLFAQRGKDGDVSTSSIVGGIANAYTFLTTDASAGSSALTVNSNTLNSGFFSSNLAPGDLIMIIQMQGVETNVYIPGWVATYSLNTPTYGDQWGEITNYHNCGQFEFAEVESVSGGATINLQCGLENSYTASGHVQVIRIPRFNNLTVDATLSAPAWNGTTGGIVSLEVDGILNATADPAIDVSGLGFRGGVSNDNNSTNGGPSANGFFGSYDDIEGAEKGESVVGFYTEYDALNSRYCKGAFANGGGGANYHNSGGGGGANAGLGTYTGFGNPDRGAGNIWDNAWNQEAAGFATSSSSGGGRGGYSHSNSNQNAASVGPADAAWGAPDNRRNVGGRGGRPLDYTSGRIYFGGGGGAGEQNDGDGGDGGAGGGIVFITSYGTITGTTNVNANGADGNDSGNGTFGSPGSDGAGGAGAGGVIMIQSASDVPASFTLNANGGKGGDQVMLLTTGPNDNNCNGPGGGGSGGYISVSSGTPTRNVNGGASGTTNSAALTEFLPNGATMGGDGIDNGSIPFYAINIDDTLVCGGGSVDLEVDVTGTLPVGTTVNWYTQQFGGISFNTGLTYTTPALVSNTTYYIGLCPGNYRIPINITVSPNISIDETGLNISDVTCAGNDGAISGIVASGGFGALTFEWNGNPSADEDISGLAAANYTLVVEDANGCTASSGPHAVGSSGGPVLDTTNFVITDESCNGGDGGISGIIATGSNLTFEWNGTPSATIDISNLTAGSYTLVVEDDNNCQVSTGVYVVGTTPDPTIDNALVNVTDANCGLSDGSISGLTVSGPGGYSYEWDGVASASIDANGLAPGDHELIVTDLNGCDDTITVNVGEQGPPVADITSMSITNTDCTVDNGSVTGVTATGNGPFTFEWNGVNQGADSVLSGVGVSTNTVVIFDAGGCSDTVENINVAMVTGPSIDDAAMVVTNTDCTTDNGSITGITATSPNGGINFEWNGTNNGASADISGLGVSTNTLVATDAAGCTDTLYNIDIVTASGPTIDITGLTITDDNCAQCIGGISGLAINGGTAPYDILWSNGSDQLDQSNLCADTYDLTVTDDAGCEALLAGTVVPDAGGITINDAALLVTNESCFGNDGEISGLVVSGGTGTLDIVWDNSSQTTLDINGLSTGNYSLTITDDVNCTVNYGPINVGQDPGVTANFSFSPQFPSVDEMISFTDNSSNNVTMWDWDFAGESTSTSQNPTYSFAQEGSYDVELIVSDGTCSDTLVMSVQVVGELIVPNVITPNGDGKNELFVITGLKENTSLSIRNRWGNVVYESDNYDNSWDGKDMQGNTLTPGTYFYSLENNGEFLKQGFVVVRIVN